MFVMNKGECGLLRERIIFNLVLDKNYVQFFKMYRTENKTEKVKFMFNT